MTVTVILNGTPVPIERDVFRALFKNSIVSSYAGVRNTLDGKPLLFKDFLKLARQAEIPYPLFFAPKEVVDEQVKLKTEKLMTGFTKASFSMHSRQRVDLCDVELIVKDLLRKQEMLRKYDSSLVKNELVGLLKKSRRPVVEDAGRLIGAVGFTRGEIRGAKTKAAALEILIGRLESRQIFVSRSAQHHMPQEMPAHAKFSGMTIKDKKVPFIFLATGDEGKHLEPAGRKLFTLVLLTVLIARGTFAPVNYDGHTKDETSPVEYELTAEILMPASEVRTMSFPDLGAIRDAADLFKVTPSAVAMRARRLACIDRDRFSEYMDVLQAEYSNRAKQPFSSPRPVNALKKYNGIECSRRMLGVLDSGHLNASEFRRIMFYNKIPAAQINDFREAVG
ncbi:hypothetical protein [Pengzhenrongella sicca]|uniref:Uncharacterized protein n=1 Tax=Pengzhenrongella sicca TaxID=2819238 RepID=A0A8A4ZHZ3_9MICO|nr:hypothetical protein [Pengzhenrongella sicca]QTE30885.1 hypothetical protein J4E96_08155 [Pengzhenrongella sicca]